jgi:carbamoyl-phosphate synthase small subunit
MNGQDLTGLVSTKTPYTWSQGLWGKEPRAAERHVVAIDYGVKQNILRHLVDRGCRVTVLPSTATAAEVLAQSPDGVFVSNGPGDPAAVAHGIEPSARSWARSRSSASASATRCSRSRSAARPTR